MERIKELWKQLENNGSDMSGLFKQRFSEESVCEAYLGIKVPEGYRILVLRMPFKLGTDFKFRYDFKGLKFEKAYDTDDSKFILLNLVLIDRQFQDIFDSLIEDVITNIINETTLKSVLKAYTDRLLKWEKLFENYSQIGLTQEEQRGLYGELFFLRRLLESKINSQYECIDSWWGPVKETKDFQYKNWAVEVKTTHGNNHQKIHISSERQLDPVGLDTLYLYHLSLQTLHQSGETLPLIVKAISESIKSDFRTLSAYRSKLLDGGYFDNHQNLYNEIGYAVRDISCFEVRDDFPRIEEQDIRDGVGDVKYSIILSQCDQYKKTEEEVIQTLKFS